MSDDFNDFSFIWEDDTKRKQWVIIKLISEDNDVLDYFLMDTDSCMEIHPKIFEDGEALAEFMRSKGLVQKEMTPDEYVDFSDEMIDKQGSDEDEI
ncbi:MAG: hypothetical protein AAFR81_22540 [Chloroflexota bacterium]